MTAPDIVDWRAKRVRSTVDGLRLLGICIILLLLGGLGTVATQITAGANADATHAIDQLPKLVVDTLNVTGGFAALAVFVSLTLRILARGQLRLLIESLLAVAVCVALVAALVLIIGQAEGSALYGALTSVHPPDDAVPFDTFLAALFTFLTVAHVGAEMVWRRVVGIAIAVYALSALAAGHFTVLSLLVSSCLGVAVGVGLRYLAGTFNERPDAARIAAALGDRGLPLTRIERVDSNGGHGARRYRAWDGAGCVVQLAVMDRDQAAAGWMYRSYLALRLQSELASSPTLSLERAAERRILLAMAARDAGAGLPAYRGSSTVGPDTIVLAYAYVDGTPLDELDPGPSEDQIHELWQSAERLHAAGISHRQLSPQRNDQRHHADDEPQQPRRRAGAGIGAHRRLHHGRKEEGNRRKRGQLTRAAGQHVGRAVPRRADPDGSGPGHRVGASHHAGARLAEGPAIGHMVARAPPAPHIARTMAPLPSPEWRVSPGLTAYADALAAMEARAAAIAAGTADELIWLLEHPPVYTAGTSAAAAELLAPRFPVVPAGRGGRYTYHGPGQRVGYLVLNLDGRGRDVRRFVHAVEGWVITALADVGVVAFRAPGRVGIWTTDREGREAKVGAIGVRVRRWVTLHGFAVNLRPDLEHFTGIVPCGLADYPVTSLAALGIEADFATFDAALALAFPAFLQTLSCTAENEA